MRMLVHVEFPLEPVAEPFFLTFNAEIRVRIAMTPEDLGKSNLETLGKAW